VSIRTDLRARLSEAPRSVSSLARELGLTKRDMEDHLRHAIRSARSGGDDVIVEPARCRTCGFTFGEDRLVKPGKCPECRGSRIVEAMIAVR
jgi:transcriptional regulator